MKEKWDCIRKNNYCPQCLGLGHSIENCRQISWLCKCGGSKHHYMLCNKVSENAHLQKRNSYSGENENKTLRRVDTGTCYTNDCTAYYPVHRVNIKGWNTRVYAFMDSGSNASYITDACAKKHKLKQVNRVSLNISTVGGSKKEHSSNVYEIPFVTSDKKVVVVNAYSLPKITNPSPPVRSVDLVHLFPDFALDSLTRPSTEIDILIGADSYGLHPKLEIAKSGDNLFLMQGPLGVCIVGTHPNLPKETFEDSALCMVDQVCKNTILLSSHPALTQPHSSIKGEENVVSEGKTKSKVAPEIETEIISKIIDIFEHYSIDAKIVTSKNKAFKNESNAQQKDSLAPLKVESKVQQQKAETNASPANSKLKSTPSKVEPKTQNKGEPLKPESKIRQKVEHLASLKIESKVQQKAGNSAPSKVESNVQQKAQNSAPLKVESKIQQHVGKLTPLKVESNVQQKVQYLHPHWYIKKNGTKEVRNSR